MEYFIIGLFSLIIGFLFGVLADSKANKATLGTLKIDTSGDQKDIYRLELSKIPLDDLAKYKFVTLKIEQTSTISPN